MSAYQLLCHIYKNLYRQDYREYIIGLSYKIIMIAISLSMEYTLI